MSSEQIAKKFNDFMITRKVNTALRLFSETEPSRILSASNETIDLLKENHPDIVMKFYDLVCNGP